MKKKICPICEETKPLTREFWYDSTKHMADGGKRRWSGYCMECSSMYRILYYRKERLGINYKDYHYSYTLIGEFETAKQLGSYLNNDKLECLLCGKEFKNLGRHVTCGHKMTIEHYKHLFGIPAKYGLAGTGLRSIHRKNGLKYIKKIVKMNEGRPENFNPAKGLRHHHVPISRKKQKQNRKRQKKAAIKAVDKYSSQTVEIFCDTCGTPISRTEQGARIVQARNQSSTCPDCKYNKDKAIFKKYGYVKPQGQRRGRRSVLSEEQKNEIRELRKEGHSVKKLSKKKK